MLSILMSVILCTAFAFSSLHLQIQNALQIREYLSNAQRSTFISVPLLLPTVHFFLCRVHFSSSSTSGYLERPEILQQHMESIRFKETFLLMSTDEQQTYSGLPSVLLYQFYLFSRKLCKNTNKSTLLFFYFTFWLLLSGSGSN